MQVRLIYNVFSRQAITHQSYAQQYNRSHCAAGVEMADRSAFQNASPDFSKVILTLENVLIPQDNLSPTPSMLDGIDSETEMDLRILGCELIQTSGILLKLPQVAMATGQVLFQRFFFAKSFVKHNMEIVAMACTNLSAKIEEAPRRIRDVINVFHHIKQVRQGKTIQPLILDQNYITLKNQVIKAERRILKELGFCVHVKHPHKLIVMYMQVLECERNQRFVQCSWNYMNDSFRTDVFVRFSPETIASACIYLAARQLQIPLPTNPAWFAVLGVPENDIKEICLTLLKLYSRKKVNPEDLERTVNEIKKLQLEAKIKQKGQASEQGTPNSAVQVPVSPQSPNGNAEAKKENRSLNGSSKVSRSKKQPHSGSPSRSSRSGSRSPKKRKSKTPPRKYREPRRSRTRSPPKHYSHDRYTHKGRSVSHSYSKSRSRSRSRDDKGKKYHHRRSRSRSHDRHKSSTKKVGRDRHRSRR